jgi:hypothetical protein
MGLQGHDSKWAKASAMGLCLGTAAAGGHDLYMVEKVRNLRAPIHKEVGGHEYALFTIGYVASVLGRTTWTIKHWERIGLFPKAAFMLSPSVSRTRRRLYPEAFVDRLDDIVKQGYLGKRMNRADWRRFQKEVFTAYKVTVAPIIDGVGVTESSTEDLTDEGGQAQGS